MSAAGLCLTHQPSGVLELADCASATAWTFDSATGSLSFVARANQEAERQRREDRVTPGGRNDRGEEEGATGDTCLVALNTTTVTSNNGKNETMFSTVDCSSSLGSMLPFCDPTLPVPDRIANVLSFTYANEM